MLLLQQQVPSCRGNQPNHYNCSIQTQSQKSIHNVRYDSQFSPVCWSGSSVTSTQENRPSSRVWYINQRRNITTTGRYVSLFIHIFNGCFKLLICSKLFILDQNVKGEKINRKGFIRKFLSIMVANGSRSTMAECPRHDRSEMVKRARLWVGPL